MNKRLNGTYCVDAKWVGRAHCEKCHIRHVMLFSKLPDDAFEDALQPIDNFLYPPGAVLHEANTHNKFIYSIRRGLVKLIHISKDGGYRIVRLLGPGTASGLELLEGMDSYHYTAIAVSEVDLCKIPVSTVKRLQSNHSILIEQVGKQLLDQLHLADQWIIELGTGAARHRVARLVQLLNDHYSDDDGAFILLHGEDMAAMVGVTTETVSRIIADFKRQDILHKTDDNTYTCNIAALQEITRDD